MSRRLLFSWLGVGLLGAAGLRHDEALELDAEGAADAGEEVEGKCPQCKVLSCAKSKYRLEPQEGAPNQPGTASTRYYTLTVGAGTTQEASASVILDMLFDPGREGGGYWVGHPAGNCFQFATRAPYPAPGGSPELLEKFGISPVDHINQACGIRDHCLGEALAREGAYFLGRDLNLVKGPIVNSVYGTKLGDDPDQKYFLIAAFMKPGDDYHFWGLFRDAGWACVPSKVGTSNLMTLMLRNRGVPAKTGYDSWQLDDQCRMGSDWTLMNKKGKYSDSAKMQNVGYYLYPCRENC